MAGYGLSKTRTHNNLRDSVLKRARTVGIAGELESMQLALGACVSVYDQILATVPPHVRPLVEGCGEVAMGVARDILDAV